MKKGEMIFVYGTLRKGERADLSKESLGVKFIGYDVVNGKLYHLGSFPALKAKEGGFNPDKPVVQGEVFLARDQGICAVLDAYEGYPTFFNRIQVKTGRGRLVWVYVYQHPVASDQLIESGDWCRNREPVVRNRSLCR